MTSCERGFYNDTEMSEVYHLNTSLLESKVVPYSIEYVAHLGFLAVSPQMTVINPVVGCRYFPPDCSYFASQRHHCPLAGTKLYCLVTEAHRRK